MARVKDVKQNLDAVTVELGGRRRVIQFDLNAFAELENKFGTIQAALDQLQNGRMNDVKTILWAGLIHEEAILDPITGEPTSYNITPYQVGSWIKNPKMLNEVTQALGVAMGNNMPEPADMGAQIAQDEKPEAVGGPTIATVVMTEEEKAAEAKNG